MPAVDIEHVRSCVDLTPGVPQEHGHVFIEHLLRSGTLRPVGLIQFANHDKGLIRTNCHLARV